MYTLYHFGCPSIKLIADVKKDEPSILMRICMDYYIAIYVKFQLIKKKLGKLS